MKRAARFAAEVALLALALLVLGQALARPFGPYERLVKPWLPDFCDVIFAAIALLAIRDALRDEPDRSAAARALGRLADAARRSPRAAEALGGGLLLALVLAVSLALFDRGVAPLDEGLHLYGASAVLHGRLLYRDVVLVYPPGYFHLVAGIFALFGESLWVMRVASIFLQVALSLAAWAVVRRTSGSRLFGLLAAALMLAFGLPLGHFLTTAAWIAMLASLLALRAVGPTSGAWWRAGALAALAGLFKQDNAVFVAVGLAIAALLAPRDALGRGGRLLRIAVPCVVAAIATVAWLRLEGVSFADQWSCLAERPFRFATSKKYTLPIPGPLEGTIGYLPLLFYAGAAAMLVVDRRRGRPLDPAVVAAVVYGVLLHNGYWARADLWHLAYAIPPAFVAAPKALEGLERLAALARRPILSAGFLGCVLPIGFTAYHVEKYAVAQAVVARFRTTWEPLESARARGVWAKPYERGLLDGLVWWIHQKCAPGEPFFVAPISPLLYFLADRPPAARYILVTPEFGTSDEEQAAILADLRRADPKLLLVSRQPVDGKPFAAYAPEVWRACFEGRTPEHVIGEYLSFPGLPDVKR